MGVLVKTTGPFVIPLGRGEFAQPDVCEVEDSAALRDEIARGRVVLVEAVKEQQEAPVVEEAPAVEEAPVQSAPQKRNRRK